MSIFKLIGAILLVTVVTFPIPLMVGYSMGWDDGIARVCPLPATVDSEARPTVPDAPAKRPQHLPTSRLGVA